MRPLQIVMRGLLLAAAILVGLLPAAAVGLRTMPPCAAMDDGAAGHDHSAHHLAKAGADGMHRAAHDPAGPPAAGGATHPGCCLGACPCTFPAAAPSPSAMLRVGMALRPTLPLTTVRHGLAPRPELPPPRLSA